MPDDRPKFVQTSFVISREYNYEGEEIVGVAESLSEAEYIASLDGPHADVEHIREFAGTKVMLHVVRRRRYRQTPPDARGCYTSVPDGHTEWTDAHAPR